MKPGTILRGGYGISYNAGSYSTIARQLVGAAAVRGHEQQHRHVRRTRSACRDPFAERLTGRDDEQLRRGQELRARPRADGERGPLARHQAGLERRRAATPTRAARSLDIVRAPNRGPDGLRIEGVQPFAWQTSEGSSVLNAATFRASRRPVKGIGGGAQLHARQVARQRVVDRRRAARTSRRTIRTSRPSGGSRASIGGISSPPT